MNENKIFSFRVLDPDGNTLYDSSKISGFKGFRFRQFAKNSGIAVANKLVTDYEFVEVVLESESESEEQNTESINQ